MSMPKWRSIKRILRMVGYAVIFQVTTLTEEMSLSRMSLLMVVVACLAAVAYCFPANGPAGPAKRVPKGVAPPAKDLEGSESVGYGWGYGGWGGWGDWGYGGWGYPGYGYGYGSYGYPWGGYYGHYYPSWGGYWWW